METLTLDVRGVPEEKINYLQQLVELFKGQAKACPEDQQGGEDDVKPSDFIVRDSMIEGGVTRAMAYED